MIRKDAWVYDPDADWDSQPISSEQSGELTYCPTPL